MSCSAYEGNVGIRISRKEWLMQLLDGDHAADRVSCCSFEVLVICLFLRRFSSVDTLLRVFRLLRRRFVFT